MFKRNKLQGTVRAGALAIATAMSGMGLATLSTSAQAVSIAHDGLGEAMIFPYYTTRNNFSSFFNITNTSNKVVFLKVRWNEGENSRDARDFNVVLSPYDMWAVATVKTRLKLGASGLESVGDEDGDGVHDFNAMAMTLDNSCTIPKLPFLTDGKGTNTLDGQGQTIGIVPFTTGAFTGNDFDTGGQTHDRTREGYFTVFEMGVIDPKEVADGGNGSGSVLYGTDAKQTRAQNIIDSATHSNVGNNEGVPGADSDPALGLGCNYINKFYATGATGDFALDKLTELVEPPEDNLKGRSVLINLLTGVAMGYDPVTLSNFSDTALMELPSTKEPNLDSASPRTAVYVDSTGAPVAPTIHASGADAVSELLSRKSIINDYNISAGSETDWVVTFPTKKFYVDADMDSLGGPNFAIDWGDLTVGGAAAYPHVGAKPNDPFSSAQIFYDADKDASGDNGDREGSSGESCVTVVPVIRDREEFESATVVGTANFSPAPKTPGASPESLCKEANILSFGNSNIFDSKLRSALFGGNVAGLPGINGWAEISLPDNATKTITGTPVVGMRLEARENAKNPQSKYGFSSNHAYRR